MWDRLPALRRSALAMVLVGSAVACEDGGGSPSGHYALVAPKVEFAGT